MKKLIMLGMILILSHPGFCNDDNKTGPQGPQGNPGIAGKNGINGTNGTNGINGINGTNNDNYIAGGLTLNLELYEGDRMSFGLYNETVANPGFYGNVSGVSISFRLHKSDLEKRIEKLEKQLKESNRH